MAPNIVKILPPELYARIVLGEIFVIRIGSKKYWRPEYGDFDVSRGNVVAFHGNQPEACHIGIVQTIDSASDMVGIRVIPPTNKPGYSLSLTEVHIADVLCRFNVYQKRLWRLLMEYPGFYGNTCTCTVKVDEDEELLESVRKDLVEKCRAAEADYKYHIEEV